MLQPVELPTEPVVGATINTNVNSEPADYNLSHIPSSPIAPSPTIQSLQEPTREFDPHVGAKPCSPFYRHEQKNESLEHLKNEATITAQRYGSNDLESGLSRSDTTHKQSLEVLGTRKSNLWVQKKRRCNCLSSLTSKQRLAVKLLIAVFIVGTMIGLALGITAAVHGGVWKSNNQQGTIGS